MLLRFSVLLNIREDSSIEKISTNPWFGDRTRLLGPFGQLNLQTDYRGIVVSFRHFAQNRDTLPTSNRHSEQVPHVLHRSDSKSECLSPAARRDAAAEGSREAADVPVKSPAECDLPCCYRALYTLPVNVREIAVKTDLAASGYVLRRKGFRSEGLLHRTFPRRSAGEPDPAAILNAPKGQKARKARASFEAELTELRWTSQPSANCGRCLLPAWQRC